MPRFSVNDDIRKARTLSAEFYLDAEFFQLAKENIFARAWHFLGRGDEIETLKPVTLLPGVLDEELVIVKENGAIACFSNVCTHRGKVLVEEPCKADLIRCGYHGRRFSLSGKFLSMPEFEGVEDFPSASDDLTAVRFEERAGFLFCSLDPAVSFDDALGPASELFESPVGDFTLTSAKEYTVNAHWALYCENYLEGFHIPYVHGSLNQVVDYGTYTTELFRGASLQTAYGKSGDVAGRYLFIFPNLMFNFYPWGISVNVVRPLANDRTAIEFLTYVADETKTGVGAGGDLHRIELEDEAVVESVQRGIRSRFYSHGRYSPSREQGTHHFHRLIAEFMG